MADHTFNVAAFRSQFPAFADQTKYPDDLLAGYFSIATCYVNASDSCWLNGDCLQLALNLMTAHLATLNGGTGGADADTNAGMVTSATIDRVSVTTQMPETKSGWQFFLAKTPYGLQLWALLQAKSVGGFVIGGSLERQGFRKAGGVF